MLASSISEPPDALAQRLAEFVSAWRAEQRTGLEPRLQALLAAASPLLRGRAAGSSVVARGVVSGQFEQIFPCLRDAIRRARDHGALANPWVAARLSHNEVRNTAALASLWDPTSGGVAAVRFLAAWLERLRPQNRNLPTAAQLANGYVVRTEHCPLGDGSERVDLTIETATDLIGVEVKIKAGLPEDQLPRYLASIRRRAEQRDGRRAGVIFLAPFSPKSTGVAWSRWSDVSAAARTSLRRPGTSNFNERLIELFAAHVDRWEMP